MTLSKASSLLITQRSRSEYWSASPLARDPRRNAATIRSSAEQASTKRETTRLWSRIAPGPLTPAASQDWSQSTRGGCASATARKSAPYPRHQGSEILPGTQLGSLWCCDRLHAFWL